MPSKVHDHVVLAEISRPMRWAAGLIQNVLERVPCVIRMGPTNKGIIYYAAKGRDGVMIWNKFHVEELPNENRTSAYWGRESQKGWVSYIG